MRAAREWLFLGLVAAAVSWFARAPAEPLARAAYFCAPARLASAWVLQLAEASAAESGHVLPTPAENEPFAARCQGVLARSFAAPGA